MGERGARPFKRARSRNERDFFSLFSFLLLFLFFSPPPPPFCYRNRRAWHEFALSVSSSSRSSLPVSSFGDWPGGRGKANRFFFFGGGGSFFWSTGGETERERALREHESGSLLINETNFRRQKKTGKFATRSFLFFLSLAHAFLQNGARPGVLCALCNGFPGRGACYERLHGSGVCEKKRMRERANSLSLRQLLVARSLLARERERGVLPRAKLFFPKPHFPLFASRDFNIS